MKFKTSKLQKLPIFSKKITGFQGLISPTDDARNAIIRRWESSGFLDGIMFRQASQNDIFQYEFTVDEELNNSNALQQILYSVGVVNGVTNDICDLAGNVIDRTYSYQVTLRRSETDRLESFLRWNNIVHHVTPIYVSHQ